MDFPAVTVCNQNRVHCERLRTLIVEEFAKSNQLNFTEAYSLLEKEEADAMSEYSLFLQDAGCRTNFDRYDETGVHGGSYGWAIVQNLNLISQVLSVCSSFSLCIQSYSRSTNQSINIYFRIVSQTCY